MNEERRPKAPHQTPAKASTDTVTAPTDVEGDATLFDVVTTSSLYGRTVTITVAQAARDDVLDDVQEHGDAWWADCARRGIEQLAARGLPFQSADLVEIGVPEPSSSARWGAMFNHMSRAGVIRRAGYGPSRRSRGNATTVGLWIGAR